MPYNEENRSGRWYIPAGNLNHEEAGAWYSPEPAPEEDTAPAEAPAAETPPETPPAPKKNRRKGALIALIVCGAIVLAALFFFLGRACSVQVDIRSSQTEPELVLPYPFDSFPILPAPEDREETPRNADEYFENYFSGTDDILIPPAETGTGVTLTLAPTVGPDMSLQDIYTKVNPSVVGVIAYLDGEEYSWGTGVVFTADGYIVTNAHVLSGSDAAVIRFSDSSEYEAKLVGSDTATDLAVLKIEGKNLPFASFANSDSCRVGDAVVAIGNPLGQEYAGTMTNGIISAIDRSVSNNGYSMTLLQTNAALNEGNSGGPLINMHGQVIGITNMKIMYSYYATVEGIGFAIPSSVIKTVVDAIIENGIVPGHPALGIVAGSVSAEAVELYDMPMGVYVTEVHENSDAHRQGLRPGDVITSVNGTPVASVAEVNALKEGLAVGDSITAEVFRNGDTFEMEFALVDSSLVQ